MSRKTVTTTKAPSHATAPHVTAPFSRPPRPQQVDPLLRSISLSEEELRYDVGHGSRGRALLINNVHFKDESMNRKGADRDVLALQPALESLGFQVRSEHDLKGQAMLHVFQEEVERDHTDEDCFLCVLMSHGKPGDVIMGVDNEPVELRAMVDMLGGDNCRSLRGKPKIFIIVACRGDQVDEGLDTPDGVEKVILLGSAADEDTDGKTEEEEEEEDVPLPFEQDFLYIYSTVEGYFSFRGREGTHFVRRLCDVLEERGSELEVCQLLTLANGLTATQFQVRNKTSTWHGTKQCPSFVSCLTKALYFPPKHH